MRSRIRNLILAGLLVIGVLAAVFVMPGRRHTHSDGERSHAHSHHHSHRHSHANHHGDSTAEVNVGQQHTHIRILWFEFSIAESAQTHAFAEDEFGQDRSFFATSWMQWLQVLVLLAGLLGRRETVRWLANSSPQTNADSLRIGRLPDRPLLPPPRWI